MNIGARVVKNLIKGPFRVVRTFQRLLDPAYRLQHRANLSVKSNIPRDRIKLLEQNPGQSSDRECRLLAHLAMEADKSGSIVEIGAYKGKVTAWLVEAAERTKGEARVISIDPHICGTWEEYQETVQKFELDNRGLKIHKELSHELGQSWEEPISMLLVDGSHEYEDVVTDIDDFVPHVLPSGYVVFDDARGKIFPGVTRAINECMRPRPEFEEVGMIKNFAVFRRKAA
ncbi:hypothetical protein Pla110_11780 [Polystyrenella longa]|uniref:Class I SAM-dependent methyltransferase n=1 Tax=Polystyrenella longa TaxID=2528007 RepID=A0A518CJQ5_9PLAN|nr:class I SAM-dependent methyltransferase [Polystyrenella longa]QDU79468.1 hypothetical protein Pla110_11780 [Polystyrenella longa]